MESFIVSSLEECRKHCFYIFAIWFSKAKLTFVAIQSQSLGEKHDWMQGVFSVFNVDSVFNNKSGKSCIIESQKEHTNEFSFLRTKVDEIHISPSWFLFLVCSGRLCWKCSEQSDVGFRYWVIHLPVISWIAGNQLSGGLGSVQQYKPYSQY